MRAATYLRVSTREQSSALQQDETAEYVKRRGWKLVRAFIDEGLSGSHDRRPGLREMREAARRRAFDVLVVYRADRLFRSLTELVATLDELRELGVAFVSLHEAWDSSTASGRMMMQVVGAFAEFERNVLRERTKSGLEAARRRGARLGRPRRVIDTATVRDLKARGWSYERIARKLRVGVGTVHRAIAAARSS